MMPLQRAWLLRSGKKQVVKWTAEGAVKREAFPRVFCDAQAGVTCRGYVCILLRARHMPRRQGGTADRAVLKEVPDSSLTETFSVRGVFLFL